MYHRVFAFDFDGTLAENGVVPPVLQRALEQLHAAGYALFLVTGRQHASLRLGSMETLFTGIAWENGTVLERLAAHEVYLPFGHLGPRLRDALEAAGVPIERGRAIASTWKPHEPAVLQVLADWGGDPILVHNKDALMILPPGASKGTGLERLLALCGFSARNLVSFGDGENDLPMLRLGDIGVAVADAVPALKVVADVVSTRPGPAGVLETLQTYWLNDGATGPLPVLPRAPQIPIGEDETGATVSLPATTLVGGRLGVFGDSASGKSWVTGLLAEGLHTAGYQVLLIDSEGDFRGMRALPGMVVLEGSQETLPSPAFVEAVLEATGISVVIDLCSYPAARRARYISDLLSVLQALKERKFRPHWIVLEEAQYYLSPQDSCLAPALVPMLTGGGWAFVSYRPEQLAAPVLTTLDRCIVTHLSDPEAAQVVRERFDFSGTSLAGAPRGHIWLCGQNPVQVRLSSRRVLHVRHLHKYLDNPLPPYKRFRFRDVHGLLNLEAASLFEFMRLLPVLPVESLAYHQARGDLAAWAEGALGDGELAAHLRKLANRPLEGEALRAALSQRVASRYADLRAGD
jgi:hydroxymethylpyrimidine pyrophosphatase-like HAD family hydrolase